MRGAALLGLIGMLGCGSLLGIDDLSVGGDAQPVSDTSDGGPDSANCLGRGLLTVCPEPPPTAPLQIAGIVETIDTSSDPRCQSVTSNGIDLCVMVFTSIDITTGGLLRAIRGRPLVLVSTSMIRIDGTLDVASHRSSGDGAGANSSACGSAALPNGIGGGAGGTFGGRGGNGGGGAGGNGGGVPASTTALSGIRGGCLGTNGGGSSAGLGGSGGGAIYLIAKDQITINGTVNASGAPGGGAASMVIGGNGGGGAGAGGLIGLDAPVIVGSGQVFANGGGGGGGASPLMNGNAGTESSSATDAALGGGGSAPGGGGSIGPTLGGADGGNAGGNNNGHGGGGGGAGVIYHVGPLQLTGRISPPPTIQP